MSDKIKHYKTTLPHGEEITIRIDERGIGSTAYWELEGKESEYAYMAQMAIKAAENLDKAKAHDNKKHDREKINQDANKKKSLKAKKNQYEVEVFMAEIDCDITQLRNDQVVRQFELTAPHSEKKIITDALEKSHRWLLDRAKKAKRLAQGKKENQR